MRKVRTAERSSGRARAESADLPLFLRRMVGTLVASNAAMASGFSLGDMDMAYAFAHASVRRSSNGIHVTLWLAQIVLAALFAAAGSMKLFQPWDALAASQPWVLTVSPALVRFIGASELAGALGLLLPAAARIAPSSRRSRAQVLRL